MKMFKEMRATRVQFDVKYSELEEKYEALEQRLNELKNEYEAGIEKDALGIAPFTNERKVEKEIDETRREMVGIVEKMKIVKNTKRQAMTKQIPLIRESREHALKEIDEEWDEAVKEINRIKAEFLLSIVSLGEVGKKGYAMMAEYTALVGEADPDSREATNGMTYTSYRDPSLMPWNPNLAWNGEDEALKKALSVPDWAAKQAYTGRTPSWVTNYVTTGEIDFSK